MTEKESANHAERIAALIKNLKVPVLGGFSVYTDNDGSTRLTEPYLPSLRYDEDETVLYGTVTYLRDVWDMLAAKGIIEPDPKRRLSQPITLKQPLDEDTLQTALGEVQNMVNQRIAMQEEGIGVLSKYLEHPISAAKHPNYPDKEKMPHLLEFRLPGTSGPGYYDDFRPDKKGGEILIKLKKLQDADALTVEQFHSHTYIHIRDIEKLKALCAEEPSHALDATARKQPKRDGRS